MLFSITTIRCTELDALVYGHIRSFLTFPIPALNNGFTHLVSSYHNLVEYCKRLDYLLGFTSDFELSSYVSFPKQIFSSEENYNGIKRTLCCTKLATYDTDNDSDDEWDWDTENEDCVDTEL